jgi:hypothetical protein
MSKRRPALAADQLAFTFDAPAPARLEADLAGLDLRAEDVRQVSGALIA